MPTRPIHIGEYTGEVHDAWTIGADTLAEIESISTWIREAQSIPSLGRHALVRHPLKINGRDVAFVIKSFSRGSFWRDRYFQKVGSKARRSFLTAVRLLERGVGTPSPLLYLDRWHGGRLLESYYLCEFQDGIISLRDELNRLYREDPLCRRIMKLMETAAYAIADMHDAGVCHRDLGNQNILLRRDGNDAWKDVQFIDLNRAHLSDSLTVRERARDISRIDLPSDFLRVFKCMYHRDHHPSEEFNRWESHYRKRFAFHTASRKYRHPIRTYHEAKDRGHDDYAPTGRDLWVWDDRSVQAVSTMLSRDRHQYYPASNNYFIARSFLRSLPPVFQRYKTLKAVAFKKEVSLAGRFGMALGADPGANSKEHPLLSEIGPLPVLLRLYRHETDEVNQLIVNQAASLKNAGHTVMVALTQDREGVRSPALWERFVGTWIPHLSNVADWLEVGHAVNRVKWGVWDLREYRNLIQPVVSLARSHGPFRLSGPAAIDFEYHYLAALLDMVPEEGCLDALSHLLYIDRRGAPENRQGTFSAVEKFALAKAYAGWSKAVNGDRLIVSEVNWPLLNTGVYSPVCSPYVIADSHTNDPSVNEETYASFMVRYYMLALCSGLVDTVYWWRLVSRGFGLVDDSSDPWRPRPAYAAMKTMVRLLGRSYFVEKLASPAGVWALRFRDESNRHLVMAWGHPVEVNYRPPFAYSGVLNRDGAEVRIKQQDVLLSDSPLYFIDVR